MNNNKLKKVPVSNKKSEEKVEGDILSAGYTEIEVQRMAAYLKALELLLNNHK